MIFRTGQIFLPLSHKPRVWQTDGRTDRLLFHRAALHVAW